MKNFIKNKIYEFLRYKKEIEGISINSYRTYELNLLQMLKEADFQKEADILEINLMPYRLKISDNSKKTIAKKVSIVRSFVKYLRDNSHTVKLIGDETVKVPKTLPKPVEFDYIKEALNLANTADRIIVLLLYGLGVRISELANIKKDDINDGWIRVKGKGDKVREIPVLPVIESEIREYLKKNGTFLYLFEKNGKKLSENSLRYRVNKVFKQIGVKVTPHQLRHSYASDLLNRGGRISDVSKLLGHSSLSTTQIYTKLGNGYKMKNYKGAHPLCKDIYGKN